VALAASPMVGGDAAAAIRIESSVQP